jgi:hypothetical protein
VQYNQHGLDGAMQHWMQMVQELLTTDPKSISLGHPAFKYVWEVLQAMMQP